MQTPSRRSMHDPGCSREQGNKGLIHSRQLGELLETAACVRSHLNSGRGEQGENNVNRKLALTLIALMAGMFFTEPMARADIVNFNLSSPAFVGMPGQNVNFFGTISAPGDQQR